MTMTDIDDATWAHPVQGRNLRAATLGDELGAEATLLVFLRHLG